MYIHEISYRHLLSKLSDFKNPFILMEIYLIKVNDAKDISSDEGYSRKNAGGEGGGGGQYILVHFLFFSVTPVAVKE